MNAILDPNSTKMQLGFKCALWLSLLVFVVATWSMRYPYRPDLAVAGLAMPGFLIKSRSYKILAVVVILFALHEAWYSEWLMNVEAPYND